MAVELEDGRQLRDRKPERCGALKVPESVSDGGDDRSEYAAVTDLLEERENKKEGYDETHEWKMSTNGMGMQMELES